MNTTKTIRVQKQFSITQNGYSAGVYGCTNQVYQVVFINKEGQLDSIVYQTRVYHNTDHELARLFAEKGYKRCHIGTGAIKQYTRADRKYISSFTDAQEYILSKV